MLKIIWHFEKWIGIDFRQLINSYPFFKVPYRSVGALGKSEGDTPIHDFRHNVRCNINLISPYKVHHSKDFVIALSFMYATLSEFIS